MTPAWLPKWTLLPIFDFWMQKTCKNINIQSIFFTYVIHVFLKVLTPLSECGKII
jgi:hypothetical protein